MMIPIRNHCVPAYIGIGSNLNDPVTQVDQTLRELNHIPDTHCTARSGLYRSKPQGPQDQPDFINAAACLMTELSPEALLTALQDIENAHHRQRTRYWGPRTLDLDILLYDDLVQHTSRLTIPHPRLQERAFVLYPLRDIAPALNVPGLGTLETLIERLPPQGVEPLDRSLG